jgi:ABC-type uncharacterized transport system permease subunit
LVLAERQLALAGYAFNCWASPLGSISEKLGTLVTYGFKWICVAAIGVKSSIGIIFASHFSLEAF